jgi:hypothetical protein
MQRKIRIYIRKMRIYIRKMRIYLRKMRIYIHVSIRMFSYLLICVYVYVGNGWYIAISDIQTKTMLVLWMKIRN